MSSHCISQENATFAAAMQSENLLNINLAHAAEAAKRLSIELSDRFFADLGQEEISGGDIHVDIMVKASADNIYNVDIHINGYVTVACDRCLDPLNIDVKTSDTIKVKDGEPTDSDAVDMLYTEGATPNIDLSWQIYEIVETSLPMQRVHKEGECNSEVTSYIIREVDDEDEDF